MNPTKFLKILCLLISVKRVIGEYECISRDYGEGAAVCVCNATYCDTLSAVKVLKSSNFYLYTSTKSGLRFKQEIRKFENEESASEFRNNTSSTITIDTENKYQTILGWGGAFTDATGINIASLKKETQNKLMRSYFSSDGIEYSLCRVPIGGTDFSTHGYSYDDGVEDSDLINFKLTVEDLKYKIPYMQYAKSLTSNSIRFFGSAWTAPKWMKTNNEYYGYGFLKDEMYQAWANYFVKFLDKYAEYNLTIWGITTGNEPNTAFYPGEVVNVVGWTRETMGKWILNNLGPTIRNSSHNEIKLMVLDDIRLYLPGYVKDVLDNPDTDKYVDGIAFHWYSNPESFPSRLTETHNMFPEKFLLSTEACNLILFDNKPVVLGSWERSEYYSLDIIQDMQNWVSGWVDWNMALDLLGGPSYVNNFVDSPIIVNSTGDEFYKQPMFYHLGHFSKFIPRDSIRIDVITNTEKLNVVAFQRPDNGIVLVVLNCNEESVDVEILEKSKRSAFLNISGRSITTMIYWN